MPVFQAALAPDPHGEAAVVNTTRCRDAECGAEVFFAAVQRRDGSIAPKPMPVDAAPAPMGGLELLELSGCGPTVRVLPDAERAEASDRRYESHFATCPAAARFRARKAGRG